MNIVCPRNKLHVSCLSLHSANIHRNNTQVCMFFSWAIPGLFPFIIVFSMQVTSNKCSYKFCQLLDSNRGPLVSEATTLLTEAQPLPIAMHVGVY